jgi:hypothetical protein
MEESQRKDTVNSHSLGSSLSPRVARHCLNISGVKAARESTKKVIEFLDSVKQTRRQKMQKNKLIHECAEIMKTPKVMDWYTQHLLGKNQGDTIKSLEAGVAAGDITMKEALSIALIVGFQWTVNFKGVP